MTSTAHLSVAGHARPGSSRDRSRDDLYARPCVQIIGASRPSAVRALLARSVTMTALAIERRIRARRRQRSTQARDLVRLQQWSRRRAARAQYEAQLAWTASARDRVVLN
jgi:hypothetical protein